MRGKGIDDADLSINWADLMKHKHGFTDPVPRSLRASLTSNGIDTLHGIARFTDQNSIEIRDTPYEATHFLIATGARPRPLDFPGHEQIARGIEAGIELQRSTTITAIEKSERGYQVSVERSGQAETLEFDLVVHGAGRTPELASLDLDAAGVDWDQRGVRVAAHLQSTTNPAVYAAGDFASTPGMPLTPVAGLRGQGRRVQHA